MPSLTLPASGLYDEMFDAAAPRAHYAQYADWLNSQSDEALATRRNEADLLFRRYGITFSVCRDAYARDRQIPFDIIPRVLPASDWAVLERGLRQRMQALNAFLHDIYHTQDIVSAGVIPAEQVLGNPLYQVAMHGLALPNQVYAHVAGIDIIRHADGQFYVLEDNLCVPSGVSYMLESRKMMRRLFPELFTRMDIAPVEHYPNLLLQTLREASPVEQPTVVVLTPGRHNAAYFEHAFLARQMGVELVEGQDLLVKNDRVWMRTTAGLQGVDVIYRRIEEDFLDPLAGNPESLLGVPGLLSVYRKGQVALCNAPGTGVADDKSVYPFVPDMIRFYLSETPILNNVPTWQLRKPDDLAYALTRLPELVIKEVHGSGGYGMLIGPLASRSEIADFRQRILAKPAHYIAQPTLALSTCPTLVEAGIAPRHVDLRPFVLSGRDTRIVAGGLSRVALEAGSLVVNSSQGGGTKDTWIVENA